MAEVSEFTTDIFMETMDWIELFQKKKHENVREANSKGRHLKRRPFMNVMISIFLRFRLAFEAT